MIICKTVKERFSIGPETMKKEKIEQSAHSHKIACGNKMANNIALPLVIYNNIIYYLVCMSHQFQNCLDLDRLIQPAYIHKIQKIMIQIVNVRICK